MDSRPCACKHEGRGPEKVSMAKWIKGHCLHFQQVPAFSSSFGWLDNYRTIPIIKPMRYNNFSNLFWNRTLLFQNKFEKLVHLNGFIIEICHDAQSFECQNTE